MFGEFGYLSFVLFIDISSTYSKRIKFWNDLSMQNKITEMWILLFIKLEKSVSLFLKQADCSKVFYDIKFKLQIQNIKNYTLIYKKKQQ